MMIRAYIDPPEDFDMTQLLLKLDEEVYFDMPHGEEGCGILKSVQRRPNGILRLYIELCEPCRNRFVAIYN